MYKAAEPPERAAVEKIVVADSVVEKAAVAGSVVEKVAVAGSVVEKAAVAGSVVEKTVAVDFAVVPVAATFVYGAVGFYFRSYRRRRNLLPNKYHNIYKT